MLLQALQVPLHACCIARLQQAVQCCNGCICTYLTRSCPAGFSYQRTNEQGNWCIWAEELDPAAADGCAGLQGFSLCGAACAGCCQLAPGCKATAVAGRNLRQDLLCSMCG